MRKIILSIFGLLLLLLLLFFVILMSNSPEGLSGRQKVMKIVYPLIMKAGKWFGAKASRQENLSGKLPAKPLSDLKVMLNNNSMLDLQSLKGKKILLVNTASDCGYTAQYETLQQLYEKYSPKLVVIGFPANDFKEQEKGSDEEIAAFCKVNFGVSFPLAKKSKVVKGDGQDPVFKWLSDSSLNGWCNQQPEWNFSKYLVDENGVLTNYFAPGISPMDEKVIEAILK